jgi:hypothetical protein
VLATLRVAANLGAAAQAIAAWGSSEYRYRDSKQTERILDSRTLPAIATAGFG